MNGPRIVAVVLASMATLAYLALRGWADADVERGLEQTELAFNMVEEELRLLEPDYLFLSSQGLKLTIKEHHDAIRTALADLRARRLGIRNDPELTQRERLPAMRALIAESDSWLAAAREFRASLVERGTFLRAATALLEETELNRDRLDTLSPQTAEQEASRSALASSFVQLRSRAQQADALLRRNVTQGKIVAGSVLSSLRELREGQRRLLRAIPGGSP